MSLRRSTFRRFGTASLLTGGVVAAVLALSIEPAVAAPATPSAPPAHADQGQGQHGKPVPATPKLASVPNFRDIAGTGAGYTTADGHHVRRGVFYRSGVIAPDAADLTTLGRLHLSAAYDLRTDTEIAAQADVLPKGVKYTHIPVLASNDGADISGITTADAAREFIEAGYRANVDDAVSRTGYRQLLTDMANQNGPQVFHCTAGKDRTGWATALLLGIAGVPRQTILADYQLTNEYNAASNQATLDQVTAAKGDAAAAVYLPLLTADPAYLNASFAEVDKNYGTFDNFLTKGLGLNKATIAKLRAKLVH